MTESIFDEYQRAAQRTSRDDVDKIGNGCLGLIGETGELADVVKKWKYQSAEDAELPRDRIIGEAGDVCWYVAELAAGLGRSMAEVGREISGNVWRFECMSLVRKIVALNETVSRIGFVCTHEKIADVLMMGLTDVLVVLECILREVGSNLGEAMARNINKLRERYPEGFDPERSMHRERYEQPEE